MRSTRFRLHVGIEGETRKRDGRGERGGGEESGCMRLEWVGSDAFLLVPSHFRGNSTQARDTPAGQQHSISLFEPIILVYCIC
jgi:hypothetical protein